MDISLQSVRERCSFLMQYLFGFDSVSDLSRRVQNLLRKCIFILLPTVVLTHVDPDYKAPIVRANGVAWMDGMRGMGACMACVCHMIWAHYDSLFHAPHELLLMFFIVGGYCASKRSLVMMNQTDQLSRGSLLQALSGSTFRRFFRLFLPLITSSFILAVMCHLGAYEPMRPFCENVKLRRLYFKSPIFRPRVLKRFETWDRQMSFLLDDMLKNCNVFPQAGYGPKHNAFLWTIREEFRASMHLFLALLAFSQMRPRARLIGLLVLSQYYVYCKRWEILMYFWGACAAQGEIMILRKLEERKQRLTNVQKNDLLPVLKEKPLDDSPFQSSSRPVKQPRSLRNILIWNVTFIISFVFIFYPMDGFNKGADKRHPFYHYFNKFVPSFYVKKEKVFPGIGVVLNLICICTSSPDGYLQRALTNRLAIYLGRNFYATLICSYPVLCMGGFMFPHYAWRVIGGGFDVDQDGNLTGTIGKNQPNRHILGMWIGCIMCLALCIWASDVFTREVDARCVRFTKWLEAKCFVTEESEVRTTGSRHLN